MQSIQANGKAYCLKCVGKQVGERNSLARAGSKCRFGSKNSIFYTNVDGLVETMCTGMILFCVLVCGNCAYNDQLGTNRPKSSLHYTIPIKVTSIPKVSDEDQKVNFYIEECKELSKMLEKSLEINKKLISEHNRVVSEQEVTRIPKVSDENLTVNFYIQESKELSKRLEKSLEINLVVSEHNRLVSAQKVTRIPKVSDEDLKVNFYIQEKHNRVVSEHKRVNHDLIVEQKKLSAENLKLHDKIDRIKNSFATYSIFQVISENDNLKIEIEELRNKLSILSPIYI